MALLRRVKTLAVIVITLLSFHWLTPALQRKSPVAAISGSKEQRRNIGAAEVGGDAANRHAANVLDKLPLHFEENKGRAANGSKFSARAAGLDVSITPTEAVIYLRAAEQGAKAFRRATFTRIAGLPESYAAPTSPSRQTASLRMQLVGANRRARLNGENQLSARTNYFVGNDPQRWRSDVPNYERVKVQEVYHGVEVIYYGSGQQLEYDFNVAPGATYKAIRLRFSGAKRIAIDDSGDLVIDTPAGQICQHKPIAYQLINSSHKEIPARYVVYGKREVRFLVDPYDERLPLVIDPVLSYSTYFGGHGDDRISGMAVDTSGSVYITGTTNSSDLPLKVAVQPVHIPPFADVFIAKLNPSGTELVYSTYLGGSGGDAGVAIAVDGAGNAYVTGITSSIDDFPTTAGAFQSTLAGGRNFDAFVVKLSPDGRTLSYSTYLGGGQPMFDAYDYGNSIAVDAFGNAYVAGKTLSTDFPTTPGVVQRALSTTQNAFVTKLNATGSGLLYSTYLGGSRYDEALGIALDAAGNAYVTGYTGSPDFPVTAGALQSGLGRDSSGPSYSADAFITKLNAEGTALVYSTYLGGGGLERGNAITVDAAGSAYVTGLTASFNFPTTGGGLKRAFGGGFYKSGNSGRQWQISNAGLATPTPSALAVDPKVSGHLYFATADGLYTSTDGGDSWRQANNVRISRLVIDAINPATLYGSGGAGIMKSSDGGLTWAAANNGLPPVFSVNELLIDPVNPANLYVIGMGFFAAEQTVANVTGRRASQSLQGPPPPTPHYFFKSTDAGATWEEIRSLFLFQQPSSLAIDPQDPSRLFVNSAGFLYRTQDGGVTWRLINGRALYAPLVVDPKTPATLYGGGIGVAKSTDDGRTWVDNRNGLPEHLGLRNLYVVPTTPTTLYASTRDGIFRSTDAGANWQASNIAGDIAFVGFDVLNTSMIYTGVNDPGDAFVAKLNASGSALLYATYLGGQSGDEALSIATDNAGNTYVTGLTFSSSFPTRNALQGTKPQSTLEYTPGSIVAFLTKLNVTGSEVLYSTYLGGNDYTSALSVSVSRAGEVYVAGQTAAANFPVKVALQPAVAGELDAFILKFAAPRVTACALTGKHLIVDGEGFDEGATILLNGEAQSTKDSAANPTTMLLAKKAGKQIAPGQSVTIQVRNGDGTLSNELGFARSFQ